MTAETLFLHDKIIKDQDLEIIFHKDYVWIYNEEPFPVVSFMLINCQGLSTVNFEDIDEHNDGVMIDVRQENNLSIFETTDMGGIKVKIICEKVNTVERDYDKKDYVKLIKEILKQRDNEHETVIKYSNQISEFKHFLNREHGITKRKIAEANWLSEDKKHFLEGEQKILQKLIETIKL